MDSFPRSSADDPARRRRRMIRWGLQGTIALAGILLAGRMIRALSWDELIQRMREADGVLLAAAIVFLLLRWYFWQARWGSSLTRCGHRTTLLRRGSALMASLFINHVAVRFFGGVLRGRYLADGVARDFPRQYGIVLFDQLMHQLATTVFTWLAVAYVLFRLGSNALGVTALATLALLAAAVPFVIGREGWVRRLAKRIGESTRRSRRLHGLVQQSSEIPRIFSTLLASKPHVGRSAVLTWTYIAANVLAQWLVFRGIDADVSLLTVAAVLGIGSVIGSLTGVPGGLGPMEAALLGGYDLLGIDPLEAAAGTLLYRGLHYILVLGLGLPSLLVVELGLERARASHSVSEPDSERGSELEARAADQLGQRAPRS